MIYLIIQFLILVFYLIKFSIFQILVFLKHYFTVGKIDDKKAIKKDELIEKEEEYLERFEYEYFVTEIRTSSHSEDLATSIKKGSTNLGIDGIAYRINGCGIYTDIYIDSPEIIIPLESTIVLPD